LFLWMDSMMSPCVFDHQTVSYLISSHLSDPLLTLPLLSSCRLATLVCARTFTSRALWLARRQSTLGCGRITSVLIPKRTWTPGWEPWTRLRWCRTAPTHSSGKDTHVIIQSELTWSVVITLNQSAVEFQHNRKVCERMIYCLQTCSFLVK